MKIDSQNYDEMRAWLGHLSREVFPDAPSHANPILTLDGIAATSPAQAQKGLAMAIGDIIDLTRDWTEERVAAIDTELKKKNLPTLSVVRIKFSKVVQRAVKRRKISNEIEYYAVRNAVDLYDKEPVLLLNLLTSYEERAMK